MGPMNIKGAVACVLMMLKTTFQQSGYLSSYPISGWYQKYYLDNIA